MNCFSCLHSRTCFMRIEVTRTIQSFKLLAEDSIEAKNTNRTHSVGDVWGTIAGACTEYVNKEEQPSWGKGIPERAKEWQAGLNSETKEVSNMITKKLKSVNELNTKWESTIDAGTIPEPEKFCSYPDCSCLYDYGVLDKGPGNMCLRGYPRPSNENKKETPAGEYE